MDLKELQAMGAFVPVKLVKKEVSIKRPGSDAEEKLTVWVRRGNASESIDMLTEEGGRRAAKAIHLAICDKEGNRVFPTLEHVIGNGKAPEDEGYLGALAEWLFFPLIVAINEVEKDAAPKPSGRTTSGGATSHSPSEAGQ